MPGKLRVEGFNQNLPKGLKIVASLPANWDRLKAADITNQTISRYPKLIGIFAANDIMALGATEALLARGVKDTKVIGVDGIGDAIKAIRGGRLTASIAQLPYLMGSEALEKTHKLLSGTATYEFDQKVPVITLDKETLSKNDEPLLQFVK